MLHRQSLAPIQFRVMLFTCTQWIAPTDPRCKRFQNFSCLHWIIAAPLDRRWYGMIPGMIIEYIGEETITVGAPVRFDAWHFCYGERNSKKLGSNEAGEHPPYEVLGHSRQRLHHVTGFCHRFT